MLKEHYQKLTIRYLTNLPATLTACEIGLLVFAIWIKMDCTLGAAGIPQGFNPILLPGRDVQITMTFIRIVGAVLVDPMMEELLWCSIIIRYIIDKKFDNVRIGTFTWHRSFSLSYCSVSSTNTFWWYHSLNFLQSGLLQNPQSRLVRTVSR